MQRQPKQTRKLTLSRDTLRNLTVNELSTVRGGGEEHTKIDCKSIIKPPVDAEGGGGAEEPQCGE